MKIATWNVNSVNARLPTVLEVLQTCDADVWCLQEIKCIDEKFPRAEIEALGFNCAVFGQKTYNGVALLSKHRISDEVRHLPGEPEDEQSRYLEALIEAPRPVRVASVYLPNGNPRPGDKYAYKLRWMDRLNARAEELLANEEPVVLAGDFNCIPRDEDCWDPKAWGRRCSRLARDARPLPRLQWLGYTDAFMARDARIQRYNLLGLPGRRLAEGLGHPHRPPDVQPASCRSP